VWEIGDPPFAITGTERPGKPGALDDAGADVPDL
jgi:hypothetical protein